MDATVFAHLKAADRLTVTSNSEGQPIIRLGHELSVFFPDHKTLYELREAITAYMANRATGRDQSASAASDAARQLREAV